MKTYVKIKEEKYIVNPLKRTIVCVMNCQLIKHIYIGDNRYTNRFGEFTVAGKAKCSPNDDFDEKIGRRVASGRAKAKAFKVGAYVYGEIYNGYAKIANHYKDIVENCVAASDVESNHVLEVLNS